MPKQLTKKEFSEKIQFKIITYGYKDNEHGILFDIFIPEKQINPSDLSVYFLRDQFFLSEKEDFLKKIEGRINVLFGNYNRINNFTI